MRLIIESLAAGLYADRWFGNVRLEERLRLARSFEMGSSGGVGRAGVRILRSASDMRA